MSVKASRSVATEMSAEEIQELQWHEVQPKYRPVPRLECQVCHSMLPYDAYDRNGDLICYSCRYKEAMQQIAEYKDREFSELHKNIVKATLHDGPRSLEHVADMMSGLIQNFGGMMGFVKTWYEQIQAAIEKNPGGRVGLDHLRSISKIWMECSKLQHQEDIHEMADAQIVELKQAALRDLLMDVGAREMMKKLMDLTEERDIAAELDLTKP